MVILTLIGGFRLHDPKHTLSKKTSPGFLDANRTNARTFVERNQAVRYK